MGCIRIQLGCSRGRIQPGATEGSEKFDEVTAESLVLAPLPDEAFTDFALVGQTAGQLHQLIRGLGWLGHQIRPPVEQPHIGPEGPAIERAIDGISQACTGDQAFDVVAVEPGIQGLQPVGGHILRQPGDVHQQGVKRGVSQQQAADRQI